MEERARNKRKLRDIESEDGESGWENYSSDGGFLDDVDKEKPLEGLKIKKVKDLSEDDGPSTKKIKVDSQDTATNAAPTPPKKLSKEEKESAKKLKSLEATTPAGEAATISSKKMNKEERKLAKKLKNEEKLKAKLEKTPSKHHAPRDIPTRESADNNTARPSTATDQADHDDDISPIHMPGLGDDSPESTERSTPGSPVFDSNPTTTTASLEASSTTTSISSTIPPSEKPRYIKLPTDTSALRARLEVKLEAMRVSRKAIDEDGRKVRTRQELIEARREKQLKRRAHKKELRAKMKEEQDRKREEALNSSRNSPLSVMSPMLSDPDDGRSANHFAFGRLAFSDGTQMSRDLSYEKPALEKKKGPLDPKTALAKLEAQKKRLADLDEDKRKEVLEKETWLAARRRAEGEKIHDSESLLKKAVKRKEKAKKKSEKEWKERTQGVEKAIKQRQQKREENLRKRREEKASRGKGKKKGVATKAKSRPGFEGSFGGRKK